MDVIFLNILHIGKTGGTALIYALDSVNGKFTPYGKLRLCSHQFKLKKDSNNYIFFIRDPVERFVSAFISRLRKGSPRYVGEHLAEEKIAFSNYPTPQLLADGLAKSEPDAIFAMNNIGHVNRPISHYLGTPENIEKCLSNIIFVGQLKQINLDFERMKKKLNLPDNLSLPLDDYNMHKTPPIYNDIKRLDDVAIQTIKKWYSADYILIDKLRQLNLID